MTLIGCPGSLWKTASIGINIGDIIVDDDDNYGERVNVAVRLEVATCDKSRPSSDGTAPARTHSYPSGVDRCSAIP